MMPTPQPSEGGALCPRCGGFSYDQPGGGLCMACASAEPPAAPATGVKG